MTPHGYSREEWADLRAEFAERRPVYYCSDRMCGAEDCATCRGPEAALRATEDQEEEEE